MKEYYIVYYWEYTNKEGKKNSGFSSFIHKLHEKCMIIDHLQDECEYNFKKNTIMSEIAEHNITLISWQEI